MQSTYSFSEDDNNNKLSSSYSSFWKRNSRMASIFATHCDSPRLPFLQHQHRRHEKEEAWFIFSRHNSLSLSLSLSFAIGLLTTVAEECVDISEQRAKCAVWRQEEDTCFNILCMIPVCKVCSFSRRRRRKKNKERKL
jgi:hypothetical protein